MSGGVLQAFFLEKFCLTNRHPSQFTKYEQKPMICETNDIARLDATTGLADSFDPNANSTVRSIAVQADGKILAGGLFTSIGGQPRNRIARLETGYYQN
jgi:hypothetical protein